ncbi:MAG: 50S ribosomal protein L9 [Magnetococcales bacterium]|nr:50S ribosomal protein L9 [Magnetococcales bacterium]MBF0156647.1 50S ribosomal protein L9 [Magnetococcales bacterium]
MEVILLEKIGRLGDLGSVVKVRGGFGRNFLIPKGKALPATRENMARFEARRAAFEARQAEILEQANLLAEQVKTVSVVIDRPAGSTDKLFGSVTNADIAAFLHGKGIEVPRSAIDVPHPIRTLGEHLVRIRLHPDVVPEIKVVVERQVNN